MPNRPNHHLFPTHNAQDTANRPKRLAVLLDPDHLTVARCQEILALSHRHEVDFFFMGGSLISNPEQGSFIGYIKQHSSIPVILFPSSGLYIDPQADGMLLLSLISGRNPDLLIGQHVAAAPLLKNSGLPLYPTGYMLIDSGRQTTASYMSGTTPIPHDKPSIAACTALAGQMLGLHYMFLDGGSGAMYPVSPAMIQAVRQAVSVPILVGGGVNTPEKAEAAWKAGADILVVGNHIEKSPQFISEVSKVKQRFNVALPQE
ncbi:geranylgeranylglyceryl/heptaprenylglyceryl phosphate synthase [Rufibacter glacialis]|uniref:Geranylgeranylglyceryl phosphate synthase n=1 Tax=Rufibacter glacialis TaxID=1259555 RepID=A0A5M8QE82_9BACT|nr:geranylgeranylglyceryl/heptaprenylglyceryl phosphate synthase [Rufibacter glacialis]KAA6433498.1 geranylgeranylglyceryl/heptaprenylglyceryl phosphate synthase [Rufibacter glacialis]GGK73637.1 geranylgeranylglyceryl phosphate synthase [Rufibacter glacialis]